MRYQFLKITSRKHPGRRFQFRQGLINYFWTYESLVSMYDFVLEIIGIRYRKVYIHGKLIEKYCLITVVLTHSFTPTPALSIYFTINCTIQEINRLHVSPERVASLQYFDLIDYVVVSILPQF